MSAPKAVYSGNCSVVSDGFAAVFAYVKEIVAFKVYRSFGEFPGNTRLEERSVEHRHARNVLFSHVTVKLYVQFAQRRDSYGSLTCEYVAG